MVGIGIGVRVRVFICDWELGLLFFLDFDAFDDFPLHNLLLDLGGGFRGGFEGNGCIWGSFLAFGRGRLSNLCSLGSGLESGGGGSGFKRGGFVTLRCFRRGDYGSRGGFWSGGFG